MKPAPFLYHAPDSVDEVLALLAEHGDDAKVLAGGQSLIAYALAHLPAAFSSVSLLLQPAVAALLAAALCLLGASAPAAARTGRLIGPSPARPSPLP